MTTFSPQTFLTNQGWEGPGSGLRKGSIKKPVTVAHKTNLKGIGKERDTGYAWWDDVFSMVANKKKGIDVATRKTSTGIHSPLPPGSLSAVSSAPDSGTATPTASTSTSHFHTDIIGQAKLEAARKEFYAKFLRGRPLEGTAQEAIESQEIVIDETRIVETVEVGTIPQESKSAAKKEKRKEKELRRLEKEERRRLKKEKKDKKEKRKAEQKNGIQGSESDSELETGASATACTPLQETRENTEGLQLEKKKRKHDEDDESLDLVEAVEAKAVRKARKEEKKKERKLDKV